MPIDSKTDNNGIEIRNEQTDTIDTIELNRHKHYLIGLMREIETAFALPPPSRWQLLLSTVVPKRDTTVLFLLVNSANNNNKKINWKGKTNYFRHFERFPFFLFRSLCCFKPNHGYFCWILNRSTKVMGLVCWVFVFFPEYKVKPLPAKPVGFLFEVISIGSILLFQHRSGSIMYGTPSVEPKFK